MGNFLWGIHHQEFPRESQWRIHHGEFTMGNSPWIWFPGHSSWIHQFAWGKESDSPRGIPHGEFSCGEFMWIFPVNSPQVSNEQYCTFTPLAAKIFNFNFHPPEVVSCWRDPQLQVSENYSDLTKWGSTVFKYCWFMSHFIFNMFERWYLMSE